MLVEVCVAERPGPKLSFDWLIETLLHNPAPSTFSLLLTLVATFLILYFHISIIYIIYKFNDSTLPSSDASAWPRGCVTTLAVLGTPNATETALTQLHLQRDGGRGFAIGI